MVSSWRGFLGTAPSTSEGRVTKDRTDNTSQVRPPPAKGRVPSASSVLPSSLQRGLLRAGAVSHQDDAGQLLQVGAARTCRSGDFRPLALPCTPLEPGIYREIKDSENLCVEASGQRTRLEWTRI